MSDSVAQDMIQAFFERWQRLEEEKVAISGDLKELFAEAKANGFDTKVLRVVFRDKVADQNAKSEFEAVYDLYWSALGTPYATGARPTRDTSPRASRNGVEGVPEGQGETGAGTEGAIPSTGSKIHPSEAAMLPQTAGSETAVAAGAPEGEHSPHASEPIRRMSMTPLEPREAGGLKGFGFTVRFDEVPAQDGSGTQQGKSKAALPASVDASVSDDVSGVERSNVTPAAQSKPNPICRDPEDCGVYASWHLTCEACKRAAAHRVAA